MHYCKSCGLIRHKNGEEGDTITVSLSKEYKCDDCGTIFTYKNIMKLSKRIFIEGQKYLCGIGHYKTKIVDSNVVGIYDNGYFKFSNGDLQTVELPYKYHTGSNSNVVLTAKKI